MYEPCDEYGEGSGCSMEECPPEPAGLTCAILDVVCDTVFGVASKLTTQAECTADDALIAGACETAGIGPEDPLSDICAVTFASMFQYACGKAVGEAGKFSKKACKAP